MRQDIGVSDIVHEPLKSHTGEFTKNQTDAVMHYKGPALVIAGPGAGKTLIVTERVKKLIQENNVDPKTILVTTFTEKAANELKVKLAKTVGKDAELLHVSTIHSFCKSMLEKYFLYHDYGANIDVLDEESKKLLIDLNKTKLGIAYWDGRRVRDVKSRYNFIKDVSSFYDKLTQNNVDSVDLINYLQDNGLVFEGDIEIIEGYSKYRDMLMENKKIDFTLLQTLFYQLIKNDENVLKDVQNTYEFLLVDEYQDTSPIQDKIFRLIAGNKQNLFVVGDGRNNKRRI